MGVVFIISRICVGNRCVFLFVYDDNGVEVVGVLRVFDCENFSIVSK